MLDALPPAGNPESAKAIAVVSSIPLAVDLGRYDLAEGGLRAGNRHRLHQPVGRSAADRRRLRR